MLIVFFRAFNQTAGFLAPAYRNLQLRAWSKRRLRCHIFRSVGWSQLQADDGFVGPGGATREQLAALTAALQQNPEMSGARKKRRRHVQSIARDTIHSTVYFNHLM